MREPTEEEIWNEAGKQGFLLFVLGILTAGIYPIVRGYLKDRRRRHAR